MDELLKESYFLNEALMKTYNQISKKKEPVLNNEMKNAAQRLSLSLKTKIGSSSIKEGKGSITVTSNCKVNSNRREEIINDIEYRLRDSRVKVSITFKIENKLIVSVRATISDNDNNPLIIKTNDIRNKDANGINTKKK